MFALASGSPLSTSLRTISASPLYQARDRSVRLSPYQVLIIALLSPQYKNRLTHQHNLCRVRPGTGQKSSPCQSFDYNLAKSLIKKCLTYHYDLHLATIPGQEQVSRAKS